MCLRFNFCLDARLDKHINQFFLKKNKLKNTIDSSSNTEKQPIHGAGKMPCRWGSGHLQWIKNNLIL